LKCPSVRVEPCHSPGSLSHTSDHGSREFSPPSVRVKFVVDQFPPTYFFCTCYSRVRRVRSCAIQGMEWAHQRSHFHKPWSRCTTRWRKYIGNVVRKAASYGLGRSSILQIAECFRCHIMPDCGAHLTPNTGTTRFGGRGFEHSQCEARRCGEMEN